MKIIINISILNTIAKRMHQFQTIEYNSPGANENFHRLNCSSMRVYSGTCTPKGTAFNKIAIAILNRSALLQNSIQKQWFDIS